MSRESTVQATDVPGPRMPESRRPHSDAPARMGRDTFRRPNFGGRPSHPTSTKTAYTRIKGEGKQPFRIREGLTRPDRHQGGIRMNRPPDGDAERQRPKTDHGLSTPSDACSASKPQATKKGDGTTGSLSRDVLERQNERGANGGGCRNTTARRDGVQTIPARNCSEEHSGEPRPSRP